MFTYKYASAFPGAIFTIPCDRESTSRVSPAESTSTICSADIGRLACTPSPATSTHTCSTFSWCASTGEDVSVYDSDPTSPTKHITTRGRHPKFSALGPLIEIVSPWDVEDAKDVFGEALRFGDRFRPNTAAQEEWSPSTASPSPSTSPAERADPPRQGGAAALSVPSRDAHTNDGLTNIAPVLRLGIVCSERVTNLLRTHRLSMQTQNTSGCYRLPRLME
ncbi:uncharacterized protein M421DRAFT_93809 [Didymella exigua CBS 183.55]|uniref:Uncharacterized protein n=1 Tax=Didymella exigua CBS 183.55 TaxID=1150837 RepID=A0A6A5RGF0_9PLEO|nr:uncharacterized protein M421DRAFT_93809 [Didymella exigua CBS 183.55]KAF1926553.1 hypothetical protein M421DRAFT_93809 [Didymella exigua CBS 183.55]